MASVHKYAADDVLILSYHAISPDWPAAVSVTPRELEQQLAHLVSRGYTGVTFSKAARGDVAGKVVAVTFDDGFHSIAEHARPVLDRLGLPGTVFFPTRFIDSGGPLSWPDIDRWLGGHHEDELIPMSWDEARVLADAGWEIGSHTRSHPRLTDLSDDQLAEEVAGSREDCERKLGRPCRALAFPYGDYDERVMAAVRAAGYSSAVVTLPGRLPLPTQFGWPRIGINHADGARRFRLKISPQVRRLRSSRAWSAVELFSR